MEICAELLHAFAAALELLLGYADEIQAALKGSTDFCPAQQPLSFRRGSMPSCSATLPLQRFLLSKCAADSRSIIPKQFVSSASIRVSGPARLPREPFVTDELIASACAPPCEPTPELPHCCHQRCSLSITHR